jgi:hypothetical protein
VHLLTMIIFVSFKFVLFLNQQLIGEDLSFRLLQAFGAWSRVAHSPSGVVGRASLPLQHEKKHRNGQ